MTATTARTKKPSVMRNKKPLAKKKIVKQGKELEGKPSFIPPENDRRYGSGDWD